METTTAFVNTTVYDRTSDPDWIVPISVSFLLTLLSLWIAMSLVYYGIKTRKFKEIQKSNFDKLNTGLVYTSVVVCSILCSLRHIVSLAYMNVGFEHEQSNETCNHLFDTMGILYGLVILSTYTFLWFRQRVFYSNRMMNVNYTRVARFFSGFSIIAIVSCGISVLVFSTIPNDHYSREDGCFYMPNPQLFVGYYISIVLVVCFGNIVLFGLFFHGLRKANDLTTSNSNITTKRTPSMDTNIENGSQNNIANSNGRITPIPGKVYRSINHKVSCSPVIVNNRLNSNDLIKVVLRKTLILAIISTVLDIVLQILLYFTNIPRRYVTMCFNINAFLNLLFVILSFVQYKKMLLAPFYSYKN